VIALAAEATRTTLVTFASSSERSRHRRNRLSPSPKGWSIETSLDLVPPLLALPACLSPPSCHLGASTPGHRCKQRWPSGRGFHASTPVPPTWSLTTSTACSAPEPAGLLRPASDLGVHCVSYLPSRASEEAVGTGFGLPRSAVIPFKGFPSSAADTASLRPLPPCLLPRTRTPRPGPRIAARSCPRSRCTRRHRGRPKSTLAVLWFTEVNLHIAVVRSACRGSTLRAARASLDPRPPYGISVAREPAVWFRSESSWLRGLAPLTSPLSPSPPLPA